MWNFLKRRRKTESYKRIYAPQTGEIVKVEDIKDSVFSKKLLGDGIGIIPEDGKVYSPIDGEIIVIANTKHVVAIEGTDGLKILIHLGLDTVELNGEGFNAFVKVGDRVKQGDFLVEMDLNLLEERNINPIVIVVIENMEIVEELIKSEGYINSKNTAIIRYLLKRR